MKVILQKEVNIYSDKMKDEVIAKIEAKKIAGTLSIDFEKLRLFFLDDEGTSNYDITEGFIHQFLLDNNYKVSE